MPFIRNHRRDQLEEFARKVLQLGRKVDSSGGDIIRGLRRLARAVQHSKDFSSKEYRVLVGVLYGLFDAVNVFQTRVHYYRNARHLYSLGSVAITIQTEGINLLEEKVSAIRALLEIMLDDAKHTLIEKVIKDIDSLDGLLVSTKQEIDKNLAGAQAIIPTVQAVVGQEVRRIAHRTSFSRLRATAAILLLSASASLFSGCAGTSTAGGRGEMYGPAMGLEAESEPSWVVQAKKGRVVWRKKGQLRVVVSVENSDDEYIAKIKATLRGRVLLAKEKFGEEALRQGVDLHGTAAIEFYVEGDRLWCLVGEVY